MRERKKLMIMVPRKRSLRGTIIINDTQRWEIPNRVGNLFRRENELGRVLPLRDMLPRRSTERAELRTKFHKEGIKPPDRAETVIHFPENDYLMIRIVWQNIHSRENLVRFWTSVSSRRCVYHGEPTVVVRRRQASQRHRRHRTPV